MSRISARDVSRRRMTFVALTALVLLTPLLPGASLAVRAEEHEPDPAAPEADPAVWRVSAQSWKQGWTDEPSAAPVIGDANNPRFADVEFVDQHHGFAVLMGGPPSLLETEKKDGVWTGNWVVVNRDMKLADRELNERQAAVAFFDRRSGVALATDGLGDRDQVWITPDGGRSWSPVHRPRRTIHDFDFTTTDGDGIVGVGVGGTVLRSTDGGDTWTEKRPKLLDENNQPTDSTMPTLRSVSFVRAEPGGVRGVAVGDGGAIFYTTDGGVQWHAATINPEVASSVTSRLFDVDMVSDGERTIAVAVGTSPPGNVSVPSGTLLYSEDGGEHWDLFRPTGQEGLPSLTSVSLAIRRDPGGPVGYAVGGASPKAILGTGTPLVLEMQNGDPGSWAPAPVDPRAAAFARPITGAIVENPLDAVSVDPVSGTTAAAIGHRLMLDRTRASASEVEQFADDDWWRCVPRALTGDRAGQDLDGPIEEAVEEQEPESDEDPGVRLCDPREEDTESLDPENFGPTPATACRLEGASAQFPCLATWEPLAGFDRDGEPEHPGVPGNSAIPSTVFLDDDLAGHGRRLVLVDDGRIFLFDPDRLEQRGVPGFGARHPDECKPRNGTSTTFRDQSCFGFDTGVVHLSDAPDSFPQDMRVGDNSAARAYDDSDHRLYLGSMTSTGSRFVNVPPRIVSLSLTGEFEPEVTEIPPVVDPRAPGRMHAKLTHLTFDSEFGMLYALTETSHRRHQTEVPFPDWMDSTHITLHAYSARDSDGRPTRELTREWSLPLEDQQCRTTQYLDVFEVSTEGDTIAFACNGYAGFQFGMPNFEPHRVMTVKLQLRDRHPRDLRESSVDDFAIRAEPIAGKVFSEEDQTFGVKARNALVWNQTAQGANVWDYDVMGWIGTIPFPNIRGVDGVGMGAEHAWRGRLYAACGGGSGSDKGCVDFTDNKKHDPESALLAVDTLNVPAQVPAGVTEKVRLPTGYEVVSGGVLKVVPPRESDGRPRVFLGDGSGAVHLFEDRVAPALERVSPDPDARTHPEVDEGDAGDVKRIGRSSGYGARLWWTGAGSATAAGCQHVVGDTTSLLEPCGSPTLSYDWLTDSGATSLAGFVPHGQHASAVPGLPSGGTRELRLGEVQEADLENNKSGRLSEAKAVGLFYDGGPADDSKGATGDDLSRRRGGDPHLFFDSEVDTLADEFCRRAGDDEEQCRDEYENFDEARHGDPDDPEDDGFEGQFGPYEAAFEEFVDRGMREVDGERRIQGGCAPREDRNGDGKIDEKDNNGRFEQADDPDTDVDESDCWEEFDRDDPRSDRRSAFERAEVVLASECLEPAGKDDDFSGSSTACEIGEFGHTQARGEMNGFGLLPGDASSGALDGLSIGTSGSETDIIRDAGLGVVVETAAWATDVELEVAGQGSLQIGEVRSVARAQAHGRPDTAKSTLDVSFQDVVITSPAGKETFSCGRSDERVETPSADPNNPPSPDPDDLPGPDDFDEEARSDECDPHQVADVISTVFAGKVQATTSARDMDLKVVGSPGGAQAMVRRDPVDVLSDQVINRIQRHFEMPALQLTIFNDSLRPNRMQVDLAAVYAETHYEIGLPAPEFQPLPGAVDVSLSDFSGNPLAGGEFALLEDADGDGAVSGGDVPVGSCATGAAGACSFEALDAGAYLVEQRSAPPGFLPEDAPRGVFVSDGSRASAEFVNGPDGAGVVVELVDPQGTPLAGGEFALVQDPDGDGAVEPSDAVAGACVTGETGTCRFDRVSLGPWVLHQAAAPGGYETAGDVAFALQRAGQVAEIRVVNGPAVAGATVRIVEIIEGSEPVSRSDDAPWWGLLPKGLAALLLRNWVQALLFALTGALFGAPAYLAHRRRELGIATHRR